MIVSISLAAMISSLEFDGKRGFYGETKQRISCRFLTIGAAIADRKQFKKSVNRAAAAVNGARYDPIESIVEMSLFGHTGAHSSCLCIWAAVLGPR